MRDIDSGPDHFMSTATPTRCHWGPRPSLASPHWTRSSPSSLWTMAEAAPVDLTTSWAPPIGFVYDHSKPVSATGPLGPPPKRAYADFSPPLSRQSTDRHHAFDDGNAGSPGDKATSFVASDVFPNRHQKASINPSSAIPASRPRKRARGPFPAEQGLLESTHPCPQSATRSSPLGCPLCYTIEMVRPTGPKPIPASSEAVPNLRLGCPASD